MYVGNLPVVVDYDCAIKVNKGRVIWNVTQNMEDAIPTGYGLTFIDSTFSCCGDVLPMAETICVCISGDWEFFNPNRSLDKVSSKM